VDKWFMAQEKSEVKRVHCIYLTSVQDKWAIIATAWHQWRRQGHCKG